MKNAKLISDTLNELNIMHTGGINSPYIWLKCPGGDSWAFFDKLLKEANVVGTPGVGFGKNGEGFFRLTAFNKMCIRDRKSRTCLRDSSTSATL